MTSLLAAIAVLVGSGVAALVLGRWPRVATGVAAAGSVCACALGLVPAVGCLAGRSYLELRVAWPAPVGEIAMGVDPLTAFFLVPLFTLAAICGVYGASYMNGHAGRRSLGPPALFFNVTVAAMALVLLARHSLVFLVAWEVMTLGSYLLVTFEHQEAAVRRAGWVYLIAGHVCVAFLLALFLTLGQQAGGFSFAAFAARAPISAGPAVVVFVLALLGFGVKAGFVPLHVWLPEAHAAAPSHVSALMSGVLIKLGLYGVLRVLTFLRPASWWGPLFMVIGIGGGLFGIALALYQRDLKRVLAYSSIENVGVIVLGLGLGFWGATGAHPRVAAMGFCGALMHLWNHVVMKGLMFLAAGSVLHGTGSKDLEKLGGLMKRMPLTGLLMMFGAVVLSGLPPGNGFASEWLVYMGLASGGLAGAPGAGLLLLLALAALASMGGLAVLCFVRVIGVGLLGQPRSPAASHAHESGWGMLAPLVVLAAGAVALALGAQAILRLVAPVAGQIAGSAIDLQAASASLGPIPLLSLALWVGLLVGAGILYRLVRVRMPVDDTWACGYAAPTPRMQYTGRSFAELMAERLVPRGLRPRVVVRGPAGLFPRPGGFATECTDPLTRSVYEPFFDRWAGRFARLRWLQQGILHAYLLYILVAVVAALTWASARRWWSGG